MTGVTLNKNSTTLTVGQTETLTATVIPSNANNKAVTWTSSDTFIAKVDENGKVTAVAVGTGTITVTTQDGSKTAACTVCVNGGPVVEPIGNKTTTIGQLLNFKISATDPHGEVLSYSASNLPDGTVLDSSTGVFTWTPRSDQAGEYHVQFTVSDGQAAYSEAIVITVKYIISINFQPQTAEIPSGYISDSGDLYGARNGYTYGWNKSQTANMRERNKNSDQRLDTECLVLSGSKWELAVPNGTYDVTVCVGDAGYAATATINVEGVNYWTVAALAANQFANLTQTVTVTDGKLILDNGAASSLVTAIDYVEIVQSVSDYSL